MLCYSLFLQQISLKNHHIVFFLGLSCVTSGMDDRQWLDDNFGQFRFLASYQDFISLKKNFNAVSKSFKSFSHV